MPIDLDSAKEEFRRLVADAFGSDRVLELLLLIHENPDLTPDDAGWVLWNICDRYALAGDAGTQSRYQSDFFELVRRNFPERAHWVVSDGTQAISLTRCGFRDFWLGCYQFANDNAPRADSNRGARFEAHRANAYTCSLVGDLDGAASALQAIVSLLEEDSQWANREFARVTYLTLMLQFYVAAGRTDKVDETGGNIEKVLDAWLRLPSGGESTGREPRPLFGSWQDFSADRPPSAIFVGMHNAACEFATTGRFVAAERLFHILRDRGRAITAYGEALFALSCWRNRRSKEQVLCLLRQSKRLTSEHLAEFASEILDVAREVGWCGEEHKPITGRPLVTE